MQRLMFRLPSRLIDTQIAAALLGKTPQIGLQDLVAEELSVRLDKGFTRTNWARRPLPAGALRYALDDVRHLFALWGVLRGRLKNLNRLDWLEEDCRTALETPVLTPPAALWSRLRGVRALNARTRCAALALVEWRESCAQRLNRPRRWLCSDQLLVRIARTMPQRPDDISGIPELPKRFARRFGEEIVSAIAASKTEKNLRLVDVRRAPIRESQFKRSARRGAAARQQTEYRSAGTGDTPGTPRPAQGKTVRPDSRRLATGSVEGSRLEVRGNSGCSCRLPRLPEQCQRRIRPY